MQRVVQVTATASILWGAMNAHAPEVRYQSVAPAQAAVTLLPLRNLIVRPMRDTPTKKLLVSTI